MNVLNALSNGADLAGSLVVAAGLSTVSKVGAACFGLVVGWVTYRTLRRREGATQLSDIATVVAAVGGAAVTALFNQAELFGFYAIGLAVGFFLYLIIGLILDGDNAQERWMGK